MFPKRMFPRENCKFRHLVERTPQEISKRSIAEDRSNEDSNSEAERDDNSEISGKIYGSEQKTYDENPQTTEEALAFLRDLL